MALKEKYTEPLVKVIAISLKNTVLLATSTENYKIDPEEIDW